MLDTQFTLGTLVAVIGWGRDLMVLGMEVKMFEVDEEIIMYAFRYSLGRMTPAVANVTDVLINNWHRLKPHTMEQIVEEINEAIKKDRAGMDCDIIRWKAVLLLHEATQTYRNHGGQEMKPIIWIRELDCDHERTTHLLFMMKNYNKPEIGEVCFCRECNEQSKVVNVKEMKREGNEAYYKWAEEFRDKCSLSSRKQNNG